MKNKPSSGSYEFNPNPFAAAKAPCCIECRKPIKRGAEYYSAKVGIDDYNPALAMQRRKILPAFILCKACRHNIIGREQPQRPTGAAMTFIENHIGGALPDDWDMVTKRKICHE